MSDNKVTLCEGEQFTGNDQSIDVPINDLTKDPLNFTSGASSIKVGADAGKWVAYTKTDFEGASTTVLPGKEYPTLHSLQIGSPVMSIRQDAN